MFLKKSLVLQLIFLLTLFFILSCSENASNGDSTPNITSITPNASPIGYVITIKGKNFGDTKGNGSISFTGSQALSSDILSWSKTEISVFVPLNAQTGKVFVTVNNNKSNEVDFTVTTVGASDPWIQTLDIKIAQVTQKIGIIGKNFGASQGTSYVEFNGTRAITYTGWTSTKITVVVPEGATTGKVVAYINGKGTNGVDFTVQQSNQVASMTTVPAGNFMMGTDDVTELDNRPKHKVTFSQPFLMSKTEITQKAWKTVMDNSNPSHPNDLGDDKPVQQVTFIRAVDFCNRLSKMELRTPCYTINGEDVYIDWGADGYRLPTEAEWEYAARAGNTTEFTTDEILAMAWCSNNAGNHIQSVSQKTPNKFGLFDMLGNVQEMCWDFYDAEYYKQGDVTDPRGPNPLTNERVIRGGSFINGTEACGSLIRKSFPSTGDNYNFNLGFRVVRKAK